MFWTTKQQEQIIKLEESFAKLRRDFQGLELEWSNVYDKMRHLMGRIAKRADVVESGKPIGEEPEMPNVDGTGVPSTLSARATQAQAAILARRRRL